MRVILNEIPLTEAFLPARLLFRDGQVRELARCLEPLLHGRRPHNALLVGPAGTGKTTVARWLLESHFKGMFAYVNCWKYRRSHQVMKEILLSFEVFVHGREPGYELVERLETLLERKKIIVCLDEVDQLKDDDVLYVLSERSCGLLLISNENKFLAYLDPRVRSRLSLIEISFPAYRHDELYEILMDRVRLALRPGAITQSLVRTIAAVAKGDARIALQVLRRAALLAEERELSRITAAEVREALKEAVRIRREYLLSKLSSDQKLLYSIVAEKGAMSSGELYREFIKRARIKVSDRTYRNYVAKLVRLGLLAEKGYGRWRVVEALM